MCITGLEYYSKNGENGSLKKENSDSLILATNTNNTGQTVFEKLKLTYNDRDISIINLEQHRFDFVFMDALEINDDFLGTSLTIEEFDTNYDAYLCIDENGELKPKHLLIELHFLSNPDNFFRFSMLTAEGSDNFITLLNSKPEERTINDKIYKVLRRCIRLLSDRMETRLFCGPHPVISWSGLLLCRCRKQKSVRSLLCFSRHGCLEFQRFGSLHRRHRQVMHAFILLYYLVFKKYKGSVRASEGVSLVGWSV